MARLHSVVRVVVVLACAIALGGCDWAFPRFDSALTGFNPSESRESVDNVGSMTLQWRGDLHGATYTQFTAIEKSGYAYISEPNTNVVDVFPASSKGATCNGSPRTCQPVWTYHDSTPGTGLFSDPSIANGVLFGAWGNSDDGDHVNAFDANGSTNCTGSPKVCTPLWHTANVAGSYGTPTIANGVVYVAQNDPGIVDAYDAAGQADCTGTPAVCSPLFSAVTDGAVLGAPSIAGGVLYVTARGDIDNRLVLDAFDATGKTNCAGTPTTCTPLWTAPLSEAGGGGQAAAPVVMQGMVYAATSRTLSGGQSVDGRIEAFDAAGVTNCGGTPTVCTPLWTASPGGDIYGTPAVAEGVLYVGSSSGPNTSGLYAYDANGVTNCSGTPTTCAPLWRGVTGAVDYSSPAVGNGVVYIGSVDKNVYAFDASGTKHCSGTPTTCTPLFTGTTGDLVVSSPIIANGWLYIASFDGYLYAYNR